MISFVIAVYRNERAVSLTYEGIRALLAARLVDYDYEFVFVDDGSDDGSLAELLALRERDPKVKVLSFTRNFGQMAAMLAGFKEAAGDAVVNISADLQDPVTLVADMVREWEKGSELVVCYRTDRADDVAARWFSRVAYGLLRVAVRQIPPGGFDFVLMDRKVMDSFNQIEVRNRFFQGDILWFGYRTHFIPYTRLKRPIGRSQYSVWKKAKNFVDAFVDSSYLPIRAMSLLGVATSASGFLYSLTVVYAWFFHRVPFTGWAPIMILLLIIGGLIMLMLGVIGEYVWRILDEVRKKPNYVIRAAYK